MVVLKKIKASSLNEVIIATIIIVIVFGISITVLNNIMQNLINRNTLPIQSKCQELEYYLAHEKLKLPFTFNDDVWSINISRLENDNRKINLEVFYKKTNKLLIKDITLNYED